MARKYENLVDFCQLMGVERRSLPSLGSLNAADAEALLAAASRLVSQHLLARGFVERVAMTSTDDPAAILADLRAEASQLLHRT